MKKIRIVALAMLTVLLAACHEELDLIEKVQEGLPARLDLTISLPSSEKIQTKGIHDYESEISELMLIMYEANGRKMVVDLTGKISAGAADGAYGGHRTYTTTEEIATDYYGDEILSGTYRVYAIANWSSPFCQLTQNEILEMSEEALNNAAGTNSGFVHQLTGDQKFPMTGYTENIVINPSDPNGATTVTGISLRRMIAHIEFSFVNGKDNIKFVPQTYQIFNIPSGAYLMDNRTKSDSGWSNTEANKYDGAYGHSSSIDIVSGGEIAFFMQENVQGPAENVTSYAYRDKWEGTREDGTKKFLYAPENATYVVVTGEYEDGTYTGTVSYTIHLGKFGKSSETSGADNFEVSRNEYHTYTITINGVNSITTEATVDQGEGGENPGAEGTLTYTNKGSQFVLDAHYETVMLSFHLSELCANASLIVETPYQKIAEFQLLDDNNNYVDISGVDCSWIHFMAPTDTTSLPKYSASSCIGIAELAKELRAAYYASDNDATNDIAIETKHYLTSESPTKKTRIHTVAFVDEYFYETIPGTSSNAEWTEFVNQSNRTMILNPYELSSKDGNSILYPDYIFQISQRSIKTTYGTASSTVNGFGIETWNETGRVAWGTPASESGLDDYNGYTNTATLLGTSWLSDDVLSTAGYLASITSNTKEAHVFYSSGIGMSGVYGYNSCLTRNRDENGDGTIDDTELKWYLPAVFQYTNLWMGLDYLKEDTQLFDPYDFDEITKEDLEEYNFYTSSLNDPDNDEKKAEYWAIEGASYGERKHTNAVRCVRNLYDTDKNGIYDDDNALITYNDPENRVISVLSASESALRTTNMTGEYAAGHNEREKDNRLPNAFEVAEYILGESAGNSTTETFEIGSLTISASGKSITMSFEKSGYTYSANVGETVTTFTDNNSGTLTVSTNSANPGNNTWATVTITNNNTYATGKIIIWFDYSSGSYSGYKIYRYDESNTSQWGWSTDEITTVELTLSGNIRTYTPSDIREMTSGLCASIYYQNEDGTDLGQWRVPNQRELMLMAEYGYLDKSDGYFASRTFFTKYDLNKTQPFSYIGHITLEAGSSFIIRCVRDATPTNPTTLEDATYSNSNNSLF